MDLATSAADFWQGRFAPAALHNAGGGQTMYRRCLKCGGHAMEGALSVHARWCDKEQHKTLVLAAFDELTAGDRRDRNAARDDVRTAARSAL